MPCVFPILALEGAAPGARRRRRARSAVATRWPTPRARSSAPARSARCCSRSAPRGARPAGRSSSRTRARSCSCCCWRSAITANLLGLFELPVLGGSARAGGQLRHRRAGRVRRHPLRRAVPRRGARARRCCCRRPDRCWCSPRSASAWRFRSCWSPSFRRCEAGCPSPAPWMERLQRFLAIPMAATRDRGLWLLYRQAGAPALADRRCSRPALAAMLLVLAGRMQRRGRTQAALRRRCSRSPVAGRRRSRASRRRATAPARASRAPSRGAKRAVASHVRQGNPVFVYFTADWCLTCKVNEAAAIDRAEVRDAFKQGGRQSARRRLDQRRSGDHPLPRKPRPRRRAAITCGTRRASQPEELPQVLTPVDAYFPRSGSRSARRALQTFFPPTQVSSTCVRASACAIDLGRVAVDRMKSAHLPGSSAPILSSAKPA